MKSAIKVGALAVHLICIGLHSMAAVAAPDKLDILIVIDDSASMEEEQKELGRLLMPLLSAINDKDWKIAVISMSNPCAAPSQLIIKGDSNIHQKFAHAVRFPFDRLNAEQGFPMAIQALQGHCRGSVNPWVRPESAIAVLFLSDEDNCGSTQQEQGRCDRVVGKNPQEMMEVLDSLRPRSLARVHALVKEDLETCPDAPVVGAQYLEAVKLTGGVSGSICAADYTATLQQISNNLRDMMQ